MSYEAVEALFRLIGVLNQNAHKRLSLQSAEIMKDVRQCMLANSSQQAMDAYLELLNEVKSNMNIEVDFKPRDKYPSLDPTSFNQEFASEQATGKYRDKSS
jgi:hypothetical protein